MDYGVLKGRGVQARGEGYLRHLEEPQVAYKEVLGSRKLPTLLGPPSLKESKIM